MMIFNSVFIFLVGKEGFQTILVYIKRPFPIINSTVIVVRFVRTSSWQNVQLL